LRRRVPLLLVQVLLLRLVSTVQGKVACETTFECETLLREGSQCGKDGYCTNPFHEGCLRRMLGEDKFPKKRVCNSEDRVDHNFCSESPLDYQEIRISPNNWESAMMYGWILQILLSEAVDVPVSIDTGIGGGALNFYDPANGFAYGKMSNNFAALYTANEVADGDCRKINTTNTSCAHILPEVWQGKREVDEDAIERDGNGMVGHVGWYVPRFAVKEEASLAHYLGLIGKDNREKLAEIFKRPVRWMDYCSMVSKSNCTSDDGIAARPPTDEAEGKKYFVEGLFTGHFRATERNNCTMNPNTCTGHMIDYPCTWSAYTDSQLFWNNISLESDAPEGSYSYSDMLGIIKASNATKSPIMMVWWYPDPTIDMYDFVHVTLPSSSRECLENRPEPTTNRCEAPREELLGKKIGSCGYNTHSFEKIFATSLRENTYNTPIEERSPAYEFSRNVRISDVDISEIMMEWTTRGIDKWNYDPREAVCSFVSKNYEDGLNLKQFIPLGYPRVVEEDSGYDSPFLSFSIALGALGVLLTLSAGIATYLSRKSRLMEYAQTEFLYLYSFGFFVVCWGAIVYSLMPTKASCATRLWLVTIGYAFALAPLLLKIMSINRMLSAARKFKRTKVSKSHVYYMLGGLLLVVVVYLSLWTALDAASPKTTLELRTQNSNAIDEYLYCSSEKGGWAAILLVWQAIYIFLAAILAFQSRNVPQAFNESREVGNLAYCLFLLFILRSVVYIIPNDAIVESVRNGIMSTLLSLDALLGTAVYFG